MPTEHLVCVQPSNTWARIKCFLALSDPLRPLTISCSLNVKTLPRQDLPPISSIRTVHAQCVVHHTRRHSHGRPTHYNAECRVCGIDDWTMFQMLQRSLCFLRDCLRTCIAGRQCRRVPCPPRARLGTYQSRRSCEIYFSPRNVVCCLRLSTHSKHAGG